MKNYSVTIIIALSTILASCNKQSEKLKDKEIELLKKELELKEKEDSISKIVPLIETSKEKEINNDSHQNENELIYLKNLGGKYAHEENLFETGILDRRLKHLLKNDYSLFKDNCVTQGQIEILNYSKFYLSCAQPHSFGFEETFIFVDIYLNLITVAILTEGKVKIFTENRTTNKLNDAKLYTWLNDKIDPFEGIEFSKTKENFHEFKKKL